MSGLDYDLDWILRTDASEAGVAAVLLMKKPSEDSSEHILVPLGFASQKFSPQAIKWSTIEQEAYGCFFGVKYFSYYLHFKLFVLETDHNNLLWMEASAVPKVIRWRIYMQNFLFRLRHIPGKLNRIADFLSRIHLLESLSPHALSPLDVVEEGVEGPPIVEVTPEEILKRIHNSRMGHNGIRRTWLDLNKYFPGHRIPHKVVEEFVQTCPTCQKSRLGMTDALEPINRTLKREHTRACIGVDTLTITPPDKHSNEYLIVIVNHFTKFSAGYPCPIKDAVAVATALFTYYCTFGIFEEIVFDPGIEFKNEVVNLLHTWLGIRQVFSLVDRHQSNGVEGTNKQILRHLKALIFDERVKDRWSDPTILPIVFFIINSTDSSESGIVPFHAHFGSQDATYAKLPLNMDPAISTHDYLRLLDSNLTTLRNVSKQYQDNLIAERKAETPIEEQNMYQKGDFVLFAVDRSKPLPNKLYPIYLGPYEVIQQTKNDVEVRDLIRGNIKVFHVERLKIFHGPREEAYRLAKIDADQFDIHSFIAYRGDPAVRTTMQFEVKFMDESIVWLTWTQDLFQTIQYEEFCRSHPPLLQLVYSLKEAKNIISQLNKEPIFQISPGDTVYVDIRCYGELWYDSLNLPDPYHIQYVVKYFYLRWTNRNHSKILAKCEIFDEEWTVDHLFVRSYGAISVLTPDSMRLVDRNFVLAHQNVLPEGKRDMLVQRYTIQA
jgi:hypothetical protein